MIATWEREYQFQEDADALCVFWVLMKMAFGHLQSLVPNLNLGTSPVGEVILRPLPFLWKFRRRYGHECRGNEVARKQGRYQVQLTAIPQEQRQLRLLAQRGELPIAQGNALGKLLPCVSPEGAN